MKKNKRILFSGYQEPEEILLAATIHLKKFLLAGELIKFDIPERVYISLSEYKFKEIFSDQILELGEKSKNLVEVKILKANQLKDEEIVEVFQINFLH